MHPRTKDLILATHGRGIWILDDASPIAEWSPAVAAERAHLFNVPRATMMLYWEDVSNMGQGFYTSENPAEGAMFSYSLGQAAKTVKLVVKNPAGRLLRELSGPVTPGLVHRVNWDLRYEGVTSFPGMILWGASTQGPVAPPGTYQVRLTVDGKSQTQKFKVKRNPMITDVSDADLRAQFDFSMKVFAKVNEAQQAVI